MCGQHLVHLLKVQGEPAAGGERVAFQRGTRAVGNDRHAVLLAQLDGGDYFVGVVHKGHGIRRHGRKDGFVPAVVLPHGVACGQAVAEKSRQADEKLRGQGRMW